MPKQLRDALWEGPESDGEQGGVTQSLLGKYLVCKERFRLKVIDGWAEADSFRLALEYGNLWHEAEEALAADRDWRVSLLQYAQKLSTKYPLCGEQITKWYNVAKILKGRAIDCRTLHIRWVTHA